MLHTAMDGIHWDKTEVIHEQENRITAEMEQLVMITTEKQ
jgi:hypothetical protein